MSIPRKILLVENDVGTARVLRDSLLSTFAEVRVVFDHTAFQKETEHYSPDFIVADHAAFPNMEPAALCREICRLSAAPFILFCANVRPVDKARILQAGADDICEKPIDTREVTARMLAIWRRYLAPPPQSVSKIAPEKCVRYANLSINLSNYTVLCDDTILEMPPKEIELLYFLANSPNQVFTREQLLDHVWGYDYLGDVRTVDVHIKRIREKIKDHVSWSLDTVWGVGYRFTTHISSDDLPVPSAQNHSA